MSLKGKSIFLLPAVLLCAAYSLHARRPSSEPTDSLVRLISAQTAELIEQADGHKFRKVTGPARFLHNDTYLICDTAMWDVDEHVIHAWGNVMLLQEETVLTSDRLDYLIDEDLAQFRGTLVELTDKDKNTLRTRCLDYNTKDSLGFFSMGGSMKDKDGQVMESIDGSYDSKIKTFFFRNEVNMFTDSVFVKTSELEYETQPQLATFPMALDAWQDDKMLSAHMGRYDHAAGHFSFFGDVHVMSEDQEGWADSLYVQQQTGDVEMRSNAQVLSESRNVSALGDYIHYMDTLSAVVLERNAAVIAKTVEKDKEDTLYVGSDRIEYRSVPMFGIPHPQLESSKKRVSDMDVDPVSEYRKQAAKSAADEAAAAKDVLDSDRDSSTSQKDSPDQEKSEGEKVAAPRKHVTLQGLIRQLKEKLAMRAQARRARKSGAADATAPADSLAMADTLAQADSLAGLDSLAVVTDTLARIDSLAKTALTSDTVLSGTEGDDDSDIDGESIPYKGPSADSLKASSDTLAVRDSIAGPVDSTEYGFLRATGHVRMLRSTMQAICDSLEYTDLDSMARMYVNPIIWNESNHQYRSDSVTLMVRDGRLQKANLSSNAFVIIKEDKDIFDQIRGVEMMAYFDTAGALRRYDVLGGASALFYLQENEAWATANKAESKMLSVTFVEGNLDRVYYYDSPHNDAYPTVQLPSDIARMKGFAWEPELKPQSPADITPIRLRASERERYSSVPRAEFKQTEIYFPGYIASVYEGIARRDSLKAERKKESESRELRMRTDSLSAADSLSDGPERALRDSLKALPDSLLASADSLKAASDSLIAPTDSSIQVHQPTKAELRKAEREAAHAERIRKREARWAELDARDAAKAAAKEAVRNEKRRWRNYKTLLKIDRQNARDAEKLQKYIERYRRKYGVPDPVESPARIPSETPAEVPVEISIEE